MARRALIIGLGSNGYEVCDRLIQRIQWEHGGLDKTPWVQFLWFETAPFAQDGSLSQDGYHITVEDTEFSALRDQSEQYAESLKLGSWTDPEIMRIPSAIKDGAANIRMLGRIAFLFPRNIALIRDQIQKRLNLLKNLSELDAKRAHGNSISLTSETWVYVVGTLCGGTCSGSFIDLGYLLFNEFKRKGYEIEPVGIFSLPHQVYDNARHRANAYAALTELNHYSSPGATYNVQYPFRPGQPEPPAHDLPYRFCYLVQPSGGTSREYDQLKIATAQYLHNDVFLPDIAKRDGARSNIAPYLKEPDRLGATQQYMTFGLSAIEFPAYLVVQACCYKLGADAFSQWLAARSLSEGDLSLHAIRDLQVSHDAAHAQLLRVEDTSIKDRVHNAVAEAANAGQAGIGALAEAEQKLALAFGANSGSAAQADAKALESALPPGFIADSINRRNYGPTLAEYKKRLSEWIQTKLLDANAGPDYCRQLLEYLDRWMGERIQMIGSPSAQNTRNQAIDGAREGMEEARGRVATCLSDGVLGLMGMGIGKAMAVKKHLREYETAANAYYDWRLLGLLEPAEAKMWGDLQVWLQTLLARIGASSTEGLCGQGQALRDRFAERLKELDETVPPINGAMLFEPNKTVGEMYERVWRLKAQKAAAGDQTATPEELEKAARSALLASWEAMPRRDVETGAWKPYFETVSSPQTPAQQKAALRRAEEAIIPNARGQFEALFSIPVFDRFAPTDRDLIGDVMKKARPMLQVETHLTHRYKHARQKRYGMVFFHGADMTDQPSETKPYAFRQVIEELAAKSQDDFPIGVERIEDEQTIIFLQEQGAFSLPIVAGLLENEPGLKYDYDDESRLQTIHSRRDVARWEPLGGTLDPDAPRRKAMFVLGLCLFKDAARTTRLIYPARAPRPDAAYVYDLNPPLPPAKTSISFPANLREASNIMRLDERVQKRLSDDITTIRNAGQPAQLVDDILQVVTRIAQLGLHDGDAPVDEKLAFDLVTTYWERDTAMMAAFTELYTPDTAMLQSWKHSASEGYPYDGFYCPNDNQFLGAAIEDVPSRCPKCKELLREVGLHS